MRIPRHVGIIPDGNRRWAAGRGMGKEMGYAYGLQPGVKALRKLRTMGVEEVTYYGFTVENCKRPSKQVEAFRRACVDAVEKIASDGVSLLVVGNHRSSCFPKELAAYTKRRAVGGGGMNVNFLVNYGWQWDVEGFQKEGALRSHDVSRVDLVIRWGGMRRLSGFLPIQSVYADFYVVDALWPDYEEHHIEEALSWYDRQDVTLGG